MKNRILAIATVVVALFASNAYALLMFGSEEHIRVVAPTNLTGPAGEKLQLARKVTIRSFLGPYSIQDDGFVLAVVGDSKKYYPFPDSSKVNELQARGQLPKPLPEWEISLVDRLLGNALWLFLAGTAGFYGLKKIFKKHVQPKSHSGSK